MSLVIKNTFTIKSPSKMAPIPPPPPINDPYWNSVQLLLKGDTPSVTFDSSGKSSLSQIGTANQSTSIKKYGSGSFYLAGNCQLTFPYRAGMYMNSSNFTIETWVYPTTVGSLPIFYNDAGGSSGIGIEIDINGGSLRARVKPTGYSVGSFSGGSVPTNSWSHIALTRNGTTLKLFINGTQVGSQTMPVNSIGVSTGGDQYRIGYDFSALFQGYFDDYRITVGTSRYDSNFTPPGDAPTF